MSSEQTANATFKGDVQCPSFCGRGELSAGTKFKIFSCYHKISGKRLHVEGVRETLKARVFRMSQLQLKRSVY